MKVLILGAGVVGVSSAWYLARAGHDVTLIARPAHVQAIAQAGGLWLHTDAGAECIALRASSHPASAVRRLPRWRSEVGLGA